MAHGTVASCVYGPVHLLRLLCKLPALMPMAQVKDDDRAVIEEHLAMLVAFLKEHHEQFFERGADSWEGLPSTMPDVKVAG